MSSKVASRRVGTFNIHISVAANFNNVDVLHIQRQSAYLIGRDKTVVDIFVEHPSCSKQHAAIQCESSRGFDLSANVVC